MKAPMTPRCYCYDEIAKRVHVSEVRRFYRAALKRLPEFAPHGPIHFNPGGIAVWGEVHLTLAPVHNVVESTPKTMIEAYNTDMGILVRQYDGRNSGYNCYAKDLNSFVELVRREASYPFRRF